MSIICYISKNERNDKQLQEKLERIMECWKNKVWECNLLIGANCLFWVEHIINKLDGLGFPIFNLKSLRKNLLMGNMHTLNANVSMSLKYWLNREE